MTSCEKNDDDTVKDIDGNEYVTLQIGSQKWMSKNLKTTRFNNGTPIENIRNNYFWQTDTLGGYSMYDNSGINNFTYGLLYNGYCVETEILCPKGWHVPSNEEWNVLIEYLISKGYNWDNSFELNRIAKSMASTSGWNSSKEEGQVGNNQKSNNKSGFTALPAGKREENGRFKNIEHLTGWWSSTKVHSIRSYWHLYSDRVDLGEYQTTNNSGFSVRCVK